MVVQSWLAWCEQPIAARGDFVVLIGVLIGNVSMLFDRLVAHVPPKQLP